MILLIAAILANLIIAICFKLFERFRIDIFTAIIINYWTSTILGSLLAGEIPLLSHAPANTPWTYYSLSLGVLFVFGFTVTALSVRHSGMAVTTAMQKMSLLISIGYTVLFFNEAFGLMKIIGMLLAICAIWMITRKAKEAVVPKSFLRFFILPIGTLLFSGFIESILYYVHAKNLAIDGDIVFSTYGFTVAACIGLVIVVIRSITGKHKVSKQDIVGGILLGVPNFFTIYLILALLGKGFSGSVLYPVLNIAVLLLTALTGLLLFKEKLGKLNIIGIALSFAAILLISLAD